MGAPVGNQFAAKAKQWAAAIERALERRGDPTIDPDKPVPRTPKMRALDDLAEKFLARTESEATGFQGFKELGDRLDGKPTQQTEISGPDGGAIPISRIELVPLSGNGEG